jgi:hypothetical protein
MHPIAAARVTAYGSIRQHTSACTPLLPARVTARQRSGGARVRGAAVRAQERCMR